MKILLTGAGGQLGRAFAAAAPSEGVICGLTHQDLDIADAAAVRKRVLDARPDVIVNAAAYTAVDPAESEPELAHRTNAEGARNLAYEAARAGARIIHLSTDFVFDGASSSPYEPEADPHPLNTYGRTKLEGEKRVRELAGAGHVILRTSWVYGASGSNFMRTILTRMRDKGEVRVVCDHIGTPTATTSLARAMWKIVQLPQLVGTYHWTDSGVASWYDFAVAIAEEAFALGLLPESVGVKPIPSSEYPTAAERPRFSVLDKTTLINALGAHPPHWRVALRHELRQFSYA